MANKTVTVRPSGGDYTTIDAAHDGEFVANANLVTMDGILRIQPEGDWSATTDSRQCLISSSFTVDEDHYILIQPDSSNMFDGVYDSSKYTHNYNSGGYGITVQAPYTRLVGLQVRNTGTNGSGISLEAAGSRVDRCLLRDCGGLGIQIVMHSGAASVIANSLAIGCVWRGIDTMNAEGTAGRIYNCVAARNTGQGIRGRSNTIVTNCYSGGNTGDDYSDHNTANLTDCFSEDGTQSTSTATYTTSNFTNVSSGSEDFTLVSGSALIDQGTSLASDSYYAFNWDVAGNTRSGTWDVGAFEYVSTGGGVTIPRIIHHLRMQGVAA